MDWKAEIVAAEARIRPHVRETPLERSHHLSQGGEAEVYLKLEHLQHTGSFKLRGAMNKLLSLAPEQLGLGVIAASTGNHGQSVAFAAKLFGVSAIICAPARANPVKVEAMQDFGAEVILHGERYDDSKAHAEKLAAEHGYRYIHSGDEPLLISGVGTHTLELMQEQPDVDTVIVPIGGGSGACGAAIAAKGINPKVSVIGVQSEQAPSAYRSWKQREPVEVPDRTRAEGLSTAAPFDFPQRIMRRLLDDFILVSDDEIEAATAIMIEKTRTLVEFAGAASLAGALKLRDRLRDHKVAIICSGGNISPAQLKALFR